MRTESPNQKPDSPAPELRYAYYRRCQVFRKSGEQCKAPAEKGTHICYAHAGQQATALRRERERRAVLAEVAGKMRRRGKPEFGVADIFMDFNAIQVTLAVMAQAVIDGRMDCRTAGRLVVDLQTAAKLLSIIHRKGREGRKGTSTAEAQRRRALTTKDTNGHEGSPQIQGQAGQIYVVKELRSVAQAA